jgi:type IV secretion system protein VirB6
MNSDAIASGLIASIDCHMVQSVESAYARLFGFGGALSTALTALLTIYIAVLGYQLMLGRARLSLGDLVPRILAMGLVVTFVTSWSVYQSLVFDVLMKGPEQLANAMSPGASGAFAARLDMVFARLAEAATYWGGDTVNPQRALTGGAPLGSLLLWMAGILLIFSSAGVLLIAKVLLGFLLALGPVFVVLALFAATRGLFEGWLRTSALFAFAMLAVVVLGVAALALIEPVLVAIVADQRAGDFSMQPILVMLVAALAFAGLMAQVLKLAGGLTAGWTLFQARPQNVEPQTPATAAPSSSMVSGDDRVTTLIAALSRQAVGPAATTPVFVEASRVSVAAPAVQTVALAGGADGPAGRGVGPTPQRLVMR